MSTWIVLADGKHARIYERLAPTAKLRAVLAQDLVAEDEHGFARDLGTDRPGRTFDPGSGTPHAMEPRSDPHERSKAAFAKRVAALLDEAVEKKRCANLVLIAPPVVLFDCDAVANVRVPAFAVWGDRDEFGTLGAFERRYPDASPRLETLEIQGTDHFFRGRTPELEAKVHAWAERSLQHA